MWVLLFLLTGLLIKMWILDYLYNKVSSHMDRIDILLQFTCYQYVRVGLFLSLLVRNFCVKSLITFYMLSQH